ncbi:TIGR03663 family protein [Chloroflexia bacterium SDU3-3]|nr:TIGR03663 family protein [Chloroflexia bacterium SDU3-3]
MSVAEFPPRSTEADPRDRHTAQQRFRLSLTLEQCLYIALILVALLTHFWGLGVRAYHHDETHHAFFSWKLYQGEGYVHDPLLHGPFLYFANAFIYMLFGDNNTTARVSVALFGTLLVGLPYLIRRELGRGTALAAALYLTVSPAILYVGRFIRHDTFAVTFELLGFIGIVRYVSTQQKRWLYLLAVALGLMSVTMESFFLYVAIVFPLLIALFLWYAWKPSLLIAGVTGVIFAALIFVLPGAPERSGDKVLRTSGSYVCPSPSNLFPPDNPMRFTPGPVLGLPPLPTADNDYGVCVRNQPDNSFPAYFVKLGQFFGHPAILLALAVLVLGLGAAFAPIWLLKDASGLTPWQRAKELQNPIVEVFTSLGRDRRLWVALGIFFAIYALFFTAFLTNPVGILSGMFGSVLYWMAQHDVQRGGQPGYYYTMLLSVYEPLAISWGLIGTVMVLVGGALMVLRRRAAATAQGVARGIDWSVALPAMLVWWSLATWFIYSWAGEKMPWLTMHVVMPMALLAAWALVKTVTWSFAVASDAVADMRAHRAQRRSALLIYLAVVAALAIFTVIIMGAATSNSATTFALPIAVFPLLALLLGVMATVLYGLMRGFREALGALALGMVLVLGSYTLRSSYQLNYLWGDTPREMMIFVQTSPDVARVMSRLEQASVRRTGGMGMPIWYDNETIWGWYTRRFTTKAQQSPALAAAPGPEVQAVLMLQENLDTNPQNRDKLNGFVIQRLPLRWWFPEDQYRLPSEWRTAQVNEGSPLLMRLMRFQFDNTTTSQLWQFLIYRNPPGILGSTDFVIAVRPDLAQEIGLGTGAKQ